MQPDIYPIESIGRGSLSIMAKPLSGEWMEDEFAAIHRSGINRIVSLLERAEARELGLALEDEVAQRHDMDFVLYPIPDRGLPASLTDFIAFTNTLYNDAAEGLHTVVHCRAGIGRAGLVAAGVLLHVGFKPNDALAHISKQRRVNVPDTDEQIEWLIKSHESMHKRCQ